MEETEETKTDGVHPNERKGNAAEDREKRLDRIDELVYEGFAKQDIVRIVVAEHKVARRTAYMDVKDAEERRAPQLAAERESAKQTAAAHWKYREWVADRAGKTQDANYAYDKRCKVMGDYAPKKVEITGSIGVSIQMRAVLAVLDADGKAALELVLRQLDAAKASAKLPADEPKLLPDPVKVL